MWSISQLKENARGCLSRYYWMAFLVCIIAGILGGGRGGVLFPATGSGGSSSPYFEKSFDSVDFDPAFIAGLIIGILIVYVFVLAISFAIVAFLGNPIRCGKCRFFMSARLGKVDMADMFYSFGGGRYMKTVKTMFMQTLKIFLWSLLFVIPGIYKSYEYRMVSYIVAENPDISTERAFEISRRTMEGEKFNCFVLDLSFIGWYALAIITFGLGLLFLAPYVEATNAEFYECMREKALFNGYAQQHELTGFVPQYNVNLSK